MKKSTFKIPKMDCMAEEQLIRTALEESEGVHLLVFNRQYQLIKLKTLF